MKKLLLVMLLGGCGPIPCWSGKTVYVSERATEPFQVTVRGSAAADSWTMDGKPTVLGVHNPTDRAQNVHVTCDPRLSGDYIDRGHVDAWFCLNAHEEKYQLVQFLNVDAASRVCQVDDHYAVPTCP